MEKMSVEERQKRIDLLNEMIGESRMAEAQLEKMIEECLSDGYQIERKMRLRHANEMIEGVKEELVVFEEELKDLLDNNFET